MRNTVVNRVTDEAKKDKSIFLVTGDAGFGVLDRYKGNFPERFLNLGVAEQNMMGFSAGLALAGYKVFVYDIIPFLIYRCYEQVRDDICYQRLPVTLIGIGSGVTYAPQGMTHYAVEDIAIARTCPNLVILSPADRIEAEICAEFALECNKPVYIRLAKTGEPLIHKDKLRSIKNPIVMKEGRGIAVLFHGSISNEVMNALDNFSAPITVISVPMIQPLNSAFLSKKLNNIHTIITVEEHFVNGGLGSIISEWLIKENLPIGLKKLGIKNEFIHAIKNNAGMREYYGISATHIRHTIREALRHG